MDQLQKREKKWKGRFGRKSTFFISFFPLLLLFCLEKVHLLLLFSTG